ncbi:MAG: site-specific integrase [Sterolibacterium sp.]
MRYVLATDKLVVAGRSYQGFPLLINNGGDAMQPAQTFLWDVIGKGGRVDSPKTWDVYGRAMYDFFAYVYANKLDWKNPAAQGMPGAIEAYRDWSKGTVGLENSTINNRLRILVRFYEWAVRKGHIDHVPFNRVIVQTNRQPGFLAHVDATGGKLETPEILLQQKAHSIKILTKEQVPLCYNALPNLTHRLMFELMVRTGLRQIECRTWPEKYVFDPSRRKDLKPGQKIRMHIDPKYMEIKNSKPRDIDMPYSLMEDLWAYSVRHRQKRERNNRKGEKFPTLFLTENGTPYTKDAMTAIFAAFSKRVGFHITAHMLRHTYATYLLWSLRKSKTFEGEPLLYVRDRLGHSDVSTTAIYLHLINSLEGHLVLAHEDELDKLFESKEPQHP